jgi:hypothetical protein
MRQPIIKYTGLVLLFALGIFIGSKGGSALADVKGNGKCQSPQNCTGLGGNYGGGNQYPQCPTGTCDFSTQLTTGKYTGCEGTTKDTCTLILPPVNQTCQGGCVNQLQTPCSWSTYQCQ